MMIACHFCAGTAYSTFYSEEVPDPIHGVWSKVPNSWWGDADAQRDHAVKGGVFLYSAMEGK